MKIAIVASNWWPIPGGVNNIFAPGVIILSLADNLVERGHDVTLFAPKDTQTKAKLISENLNSAYDDYQSEWREDFASYMQIEQQYEMVLLSKAFEMAKENQFDLIHVHKTNLEIYFSQLISCPMLVTSHNSYLNPPMGSIFSQADEIRLKKYKNNCYYAALSNFMKKEADLNFVDVIYHGIDLIKYPFNQEGGKSLLYVGRMVKRKGPDSAIKIADALLKPLKLIGDIRPSKINQAYWQEIEKAINNSANSEYLGFRPHNQMSFFYQQSKILLFPIREPESFGLTLIEAMACGTPVVAFDQGPVKEIVQDGITGFVCPADDIGGMVKAVKKIYEMSDNEYQKMRHNCRKHVEENFTVKKMVDGYEKVYGKVIEDWKKRKKT